MIVVESRTTVTVVVALAEGGLANTGVKLAPGAMVTSPLTARALALGTMTVPKMASVPAQTRP